MKNKVYIISAVLTLSAVLGLLLLPTVSSAAVSSSDKAVIEMNQSYYLNYQNMADEAEDLNVSFYPNPVLDMLNYTLEGENGNTNIDLFDMTGKLVATEIAQRDRGTLDVSGLPAGIYIVTVSDNNDRKITKRIIKN